MKVSQAASFHLQYHRTNAKIYEFVLVRFTTQFGKRDLAVISQEEVLDFLLSLSEDNKQTTKRNQLSVLSSFYKFSINTAFPVHTNPYNTSVIKPLFKWP